MFAIQLLPNSQRGPDGQRLGRITVGDFIEEFPCYSRDENVDDLEWGWLSELRKLVAGDSAVALIHDPRFAWVIYREGNSCFVQQKGSCNGEFYPIAARCTYNEAGERVSEWITSVSEIEHFLASVSKMPSRR